MDARRLIERLARREEEFRGTRFLAPRLRGGRLRIRLEGLVHELEPRPADFEGWGIFEAVDHRIARLVEEATPTQIEPYLELLRPLRVLLAFRLRRGTWMASPANRSDAVQRFGASRPVVVHLVDDAERFDQVHARFDGAAFYFAALDRSADPRMAERLRQAFREVEVPEELAFPGLFPEARETYRLALDRELARPIEKVLQSPDRDAARLRRALHLGGGALREFYDRGDFWVVEWTTDDGRQHSSAISKADLTVLSAGLCLSGHDESFDLQSLVGVVEKAEPWAFD